MDDIVRIIKSIENSDILIDRISEAVKHETEKQKGAFLGSYLISAPHLQQY